jgi:outer membrane protein assembly factor BamB
MKTSEDMVFVALNGWVVALDRESGELLWQWSAPKKAGSQYMTLLPDRDRLVVSAGGYIYCLDPATGRERWHNPLKGFGIGVAALATIRSHSPHGDAASASSQDAAQAAAAVAATTAIMASG